MPCEPIPDTTAGIIAGLCDENDRLRAELRAVAGMLADALDTPDRAARQKLLEMAAARAGDAGEGDTKHDRD